MNTNVVEIPKDPPAKQPTRFVIGVRVLTQIKSTLYNPGDLKLKVGTTVMVNTQQGLKLGVIASNKIPVFRENRKYNRILRIANDNDVQAENRQAQEEEKAKTLCLDKIKALKLPMNLSRVVHQPNMNKTIFFFTSEGRIDFRQLIRDLASRLRHRIEMKQVGVRDEAKAIGGYGLCGETLCCSTWLPEFSPVTIKMAKNQGLPLNPSKISGVCGRLMCCLQYEHENYKTLAKNLPKVNSQVQTPDGPGRIVKNKILEQSIVVLLKDESRITYHIDELQKLKNPQQP
ncbi:MAG TPA: sporulation protein [Nitrospinaceae bacterium]|jgi:cell fate regulator YaaT (PSP1 superfamily)|nr:sporulation protein [Nitrospinaceae bacterium]